MADFHFYAHISDACNWQDQKQAQRTQAVELDSHEFCLSTTCLLWDLEQFSGQGFLDFTFFTYGLILPTSQGCEESIGTTVAQPGGGYLII